MYNNKINYLGRQVEIMFEIDKEKCIHCGQCIKDCSANALEFNDEKIPVIDEPLKIQTKYIFKTLK